MKSKIMTIAALLVILPGLAYSQANLLFVKKIGNAGTGNGEFHLTLNSYIAHDGTNIYIVDTKNSRIQKFDVDGNFIAWLGYQELSTEGPVVNGLYVNNFGWYTTGTPDARFDLHDGGTCGGFEIDSDGNIYVLANAYDVWKFGPDGKFLKKIILNFSYPSVFTIDNNVRSLSRKTTSHTQNLMKMGMNW